MKRTWKILRVMGTIAGFLLTVLGLGGIGDDTNTWLEWLSATNQNVLRWIFTLCGIVILLLLWLPWRKLKRNAATPDKADTHNSRETQGQPTIRPLVNYPELSGLRCDVAVDCGDAENAKGVSLVLADFQIVKLKTKVEFPAYTFLIGTCLRPFASNQSAAGILQFEFIRRTVEYSGSDYDGAISLSLQSCNGKDDRASEVQYLRGASFRVLLRAMQKGAVASETCLVLSISKDGRASIKIEQPQTNPQPSKARGKRRKRSRG